MSGVEALSSGIAGSVSSVVAMALLYPLDNIRTRLQVQIKKKLEEKLDQAVEHKQITAKQGEHIKTAVSLASTELKRSYSQEPLAHQDLHYQGTIDCIVKVIEKEGISGLYSGVESALIGVAYSSAVYFFWYHLFKSLLLRGSAHKTLLPTENIAVASVAGLVNVFLTLPIWVVNTRMTLAKNKQRKTLRETVQQIHAEEGLQGFYKGLWPSMILVSNPAIQFVVYEQLVRIISRQREKSLPTGKKIVLTSSEYFLLGALAKAVATIITYPYQVIKSRLQASKSDQLTTLSIAQEMYQTEGVGAFYNGLWAKMSQTVANSAFMFAIYEKLVAILLKALKKALTA
jgi:adenine nucleotide transporter 17